MYLESELTTVHDFVQVLHDDGDDPEQVHLGLGLVRVDALVRIVSSGKTGRSFELILITVIGLPERLSNTGEVLQRTL